MTNYESIGMVVFAIGALIVIVKPLLDLRAVLAKLETTLVSIEKTIGEHDLRNTKEHDDLYDTARNHENRIVKLETREVR